MLVDFFFKLRQYAIPVSITEFLTLLEALERRVAMLGVDDFYALARAALVKDERHFDRFDQCFGVYFKGMEERFERLYGEVPEEWLRRQAELHLSEEEKARIEALDGFEKLMEEDVRAQLLDVAHAALRGGEGGALRGHPGVILVRHVARAPPGGEIDEHVAAAVANASDHLAKQLGVSGVDAVSGSRTWMWTAAAPALRASRQACAICFGVIGKSGCR